MSSSVAENLIRHVTLRQLQIFETVVRLGGYTRAAQALHLSQPAVSMQIKKLNDSLGHALLEKRGHQIQPTSAGLEVYIAAQDILDRMDSLSHAAIELEGEIKGVLRIAVITSAIYFMPHMLGAFIARHPQVEPQLVVTNRANVLERLKSKQDDLVIMGQVPRQLAVEAEPFIDNELLVVSPPDHPLCKLKNISLQQLSQQRLLLREPGSGTRLAMERLFSEHDITINPYMQLGSSEAIKQAVMAGLGISVLSRHSLRLELAGEHIVVLDVDGFPLIRRWYAVHLKRKSLSLAASTFLDFILNESSKILSS
jgi:DNA-binding transcriptional LysR family regulator